MVFQLQSLFFWFLIFFLWTFCGSLICFQFHSLIQIYGIMFSIWFSLFWFKFFSWPFCKTYYSVQFYHTIKNLFLFLMYFYPYSLDFFCPFTKLIHLFNFTIQSNIKFILYFNFDNHFSNFYFWILLYNWNSFYNFIFQYLID